MDKKNYIKGLAAGTMAFAIWGLLPLYWKLVAAISPYEIFCQRVVWSFLLVCILMLIKGQWSELTQALADRQERKNIFGPAVLISINWLVYIWSVNNGFVIESSLGYYINPLLLTFFGSLIFKERLTRLQKVGLIFAATGVIIKTVLYGRVPIIAITLGISFALYGTLKKMSKLNSLAGLGFETLVIGIPALAYIIYIESKGAGIIGNQSWSFWLMIAFSGIATATPLLLFSESAKRLPLNVVGFLQYLSPTTGLLLGIFVFKETFDFSSLAAFSFIWVGIIIFSFSQYRTYRNLETASEREIV
ncbi:MAG: EamA family transporter RarD [Clostridiales bacterium]|nr:EamA family transporter RarD [Clostridiales bacterium]